MVNYFQCILNGEHFRWALVHCCCPRASICQNHCDQTIPPSSNLLSSVPFSRTSFHFFSRLETLLELITSSSNRIWPPRDIVHQNGLFLPLSPFPSHIVALFSIKLTPISRFSPSTYTEPVLSAPTLNWTSYRCILVTYPSRRPTPSLLATVCATSTKSHSQKKLARPLQA